MRSCFLGFPYSVRVFAFSLLTGSFKRRRFPVLAIFQPINYTRTFRSRFIVTLLVAHLRELRLAASVL